MINDYLERILTAHVYDVAVETRLDSIPLLSARIHNRVLLKREDKQQVFSFKLRGAYNKMAKLHAEALQQGVVAASAGNHAQGVALAAQKLGCSATIVMPTTTPQIKINAVMAMGAVVMLQGDSYNDAYEYALNLAKEKGVEFIHPYDDPDVIAGQGTIAMEILHQHPGKIHAIFVPIGGGGLISGIAAYVKRLRPTIKVIGVEPEDSNAMYRSLQAGHRVELPQVGLFADGVAVRQVGEETFRLCRDLVDEILLVDSDAICAAIKDIFEDTRSIVEPSGALSVAGLKMYAKQHDLLHETMIAVASGANMNFDRLRHVSERAELGEQREAILAVTIPEKPGSFKKFCNLIGARNITEFNYRYADSQQAHVFVGISVRNREEATNLIQILQDNDLRAEDMTDNEMAKLHIRHMVGGHSRGVSNEVLYRFEFPDRPGALMNFLNKMSDRWNISLFHYRNHGADFGRVLIGIQIPHQEKEEFMHFLEELGYEFEDESNNPAYQFFLA
ncbi:L-threonine dehydratase biosynthetic IlvA [Nitrosomonas stercoris]|uniref:L-threonine dehydratase n=1 Tax=Nitrosomonas stercoris TaxID=1444684 RepID=A0A4Y1YQS0_9PROT|nr:L-threonine dehydratase biosynthetic IlvA [Nitrosomonas stercoris]